jgi:hypothetical protein
MLTTGRKLRGFFVPEVPGTFEGVSLRARDRSGILLHGLPGKRYKRIARFFAQQKMRPNILTTNNLTLY